MSQGSRADVDLAAFWLAAKGAARTGVMVPALTLEGTHGPVELRAWCAQRAVLYTYPATGVPGRDPQIDPAPGWDDIPGAAGCTQQSLGFDRAHDNFERIGVRVAGISTQPLSEQRAFASRHGLSFPLLCDAGLQLQAAWSLPTFVVEDRTFLERLVVYVERNEVVHVNYPVSDPGASARAMLQWL